MKELYILKIGGNVIDEERSLLSFLDVLSKQRKKIILVHGGGKLATDLSAQLGVETKMIEGRRITDEATLRIATMVYSGWINKRIVAVLNAKKKKAIGLSGADLFLIPSMKRKKGTIDYGFVGDVMKDKIDVNTIDWMLNKGLVPVIAPITSDHKGQLLNTNADTIATTLSAALSKKYRTKLIYCFEKNGVMKEDKVLPKLHQIDFELGKKDGSIFGGMIPKLENAFYALEHGTSRVVIGNSSKLNMLIKGKNGTVIQK